MEIYDLRIVSLVHIETMDQRSIIAWYSDEVFDQINYFCLLKIRFLKR